jgi:tRNA threonylcarbamoyladenosine biosynthesis protein TsaE
LDRFFDSSSEEETWHLGRRLGRLLSTGDVVAIRGELGAGKTVLVRGICDGVGTRQRTRSPSFTFMSRYRGTINVYHLDLYRVEGPGDLDTLGWEEVVAGDSIVLIEWADRLGALLPEGSIEIDIEMTGEETRRVRFTASTERHSSIVERVLARRD